MAVLRLVADDLTGALDSAAAFASQETPVAVRWRGAVPQAGAAAFDSATREGSAEAARRTLHALAPAMWGGAGQIAFKKIDSLLRGHEAAEIDAILAARSFERCILAPAFPAQGRVTRGGRQHALLGGEWRRLDADPAAALEALGHRVARLAPGAPAPSGISLFDAASDTDLDAAVTSADRLDGVLWVGAGGLAAALARAGARPAAGAAPIDGPVLGLFGTDHPATRAQLALLGDRHRVLAGEADHEAVSRLMQRSGAAFLTVALPEASPRGLAAARIAAEFSALAERLDPPGTLVVAGGETLRDLCDGLGAHGLDVIGEVLPGIARSVMRGGRWDGTAVISKSGAFGAPDLLQNLVAAAVARHDGVRA